MRTTEFDGIGRRAIRPFVLSAVLVALVAACGGSAAPAASSAAPVAPSGMAVEASATAAPSAAVATFEVGREAWFAGFHVTFGTATAEITAGKRGSVTIEATFENTGHEDARLDATINLASAGKNAQEGLDQDIPSVPAGLTGTGRFAFRVADSFTFDDAVLTLGQAANQQAVVPLGRAGSAVSRQPVEVSVTGMAKANDLQIDLERGELRADSPWKHGQQKKGTLVLTLDYSATFNSGFAGGFAFTGEHVALMLPDGTTVGAIQDGRSQSIELIPPNATKKHLFTRFEIDDPAPGAYVLLVREGTAKGEIPFTIR
jgi:hypothetical protein